MREGPPVATQPAARSAKRCITGEPNMLIMPKLNTHNPFGNTRRGAHTHWELALAPFDGHMIRNLAD